MKKLTYLWVAILTLVFAVSCDKNDDSVVVDNPTLELVDVSFDLNNYIPETSSKDPEKGDRSIPDCSDMTAEYVVAEIGSESYTLDLVTLNGGLETEVVKLAPGEHSLNSFMVYASDGTPIYASPMVDSYYQALWDLEGVTKTFEVDAFTKSKITIDVLCYEPYQYEEFGFAWFEYAKYEVKTICFFGDICTKYFEAWHLDGAYAEQTTNQGYDFAAIFEVVIRDAEGNAVNDLTKNSNIDWKGEGSPLCIEYPDMIGSDENYTFEINLVMPDGSVETIHTASLAEGISSDATETGFGGSDGVFDFVVGNCSYEGNDEDLELPAWVPVPKEEISFRVTVPGSGEEGYVRATFDFLTNTASAYGDLVEGVEFAMWCAEKNETIYYNTNYKAKVYSSLGLTNAMPAAMQTLPWGKLNWVMNHKDGFTNDQVQNALWYLIGQGGGAQVAGLTDAAVANWQPSVGDWAILAFDADGLNPNTPKVQLMIVRVDP